MKLKLFILVVFLSLILSACKIGVNPKEHLGEIYSIALDSIMEKDEALSKGMEFIAIDKNNDVFFEGSKFRSGKGAVGVESTVHYKDDNWQIKESKEIWIS